MAASQAPEICQLVVQMAMFQDLLSESLSPSPVQEDQN